MPKVFDPTKVRASAEKEVGAAENRRAATAKRLETAEAKVVKATEARDGVQTKLAEQDAQIARLKSYLEATATLDGNQPAEPTPVEPTPEPVPEPV